MFGASKATAFKSILSFSTVLRVSAYLVPFLARRGVYGAAQGPDYFSVRQFATNRKMRIERDGSTNTVTYHPNDGSHSATVILMHGLGDSADGLADLAEQWGKVMPHVKFILPTAGQRAVTLNGGMRMNAWYDIVGLDDRASESCEGIEESVERVRALLAHERSLGLPWSRLLLAGFSQGGAMSLFTGLQLPAEADGSPAALAGLVVMSGYLPGAAKFKLSEGLQQVPVLHCHGDSDPVVRTEWARMTETASRPRAWRTTRSSSTGACSTASAWRSCGTWPPSWPSSCPPTPPTRSSPRTPARCPSRSSRRRCGRRAWASRRRASTRRRSSCACWSSTTRA